MSHSYSRLLLEPSAVEHFLGHVLNYDIDADPKIISKVVQNEMILKDIDISAPTLDNGKFRDKKYRSSSERWKLRVKIVDELFSKKRIADDDKIKLGVGGAIPSSKIKRNKQAIIVIGLPASGKSSIGNKIAEIYGAVLLDSDYAKRKLPEYKNYLVGATLVHEESDTIVFGYSGRDPDPDFKSLFERCLENNCNILIPKIGHNAISIAGFAQKLKGYKFDVHLVLVSLERQKATLRALHRFKESKRYVPLSLIFDGYGNDPILSYYRLKNNFPGLFKSLGKLSTDVKKGQRPKIVEYTQNSPVTVFKK